MRAVGRPTPISLVADPRLVGTRAAFLTGVEAACQRTLDLPAGVRALDSASADVALGGAGVDAMGVGPAPVGQRGQRTQTRDDGSEERCTGEAKRTASRHRLRERAGEIVKGSGSHRITLIGLSPCAPRRVPASVSTAAAPVTNPDAIRPSPSISTAIGVPAAPNASPTA